ncbi:MAG: DUF1987 domain-containing protein [Vicingaceae bacterium]
MKEINIEGTPKTPKIYFKEGNNYLLIEGRSIIEDPLQFYNPLIVRLKKASNSVLDKLEIDFKIEYFNTASSFILLDVLKHLHSSDGLKDNIIVNWHYDKDDDDILEIGQDYSNVLKMPFNLIAC